MGKKDGRKIGCTFHHISRLRHTMPPPHTNIPVRSPTWTIRIAASYHTPVEASSLPKEIEVKPAAGFLLVVFNPFPLQGPFGCLRRVIQYDRPVKPFVLSYSSSDFGVDAQNTNLRFYKVLKYISQCSRLVMPGESDGTNGLSTWGKCGNLNCGRDRFDKVRF